MKLNTLYCGDNLEILKTIPNESVDCVVTSPPYWALRDYGIDGQLGLEPTFQEYITKLCDIFDEVKRLLKKTGTCFVNLGDTYFGGGNNRGGSFDTGTKQSTNRGTWNPEDETHQFPWGDYYVSKCLCCIPDRFKIEMINRGWILRNEIIWFKRNCMPSSVKDRLTVDFEKVFFFVKSKRYWFEQQYIPTATKDDSVRNRDITKLNNVPGRSRMAGLTVNNYDYRNTRCVWDIPTMPFKDAHFAVFPEKLVEPMIMAGCPSQICKKCGKAKEPIFKTEKQHSIGATSGRYWVERDFVGDNTVRNLSKKVGYTDCGCNVGFEGGICLDPFIGSGTTAVVARKLGRNYIGIDLNPNYIKMAEDRIKTVTPPLF